MNNRGKYCTHSKVLRVLAVVLALSMLLGMSGIQAFAEEDTVVKIQSGASTECDQGGENVIFTPEKQMKGITVKASCRKWGIASGRNIFSDGVEIRRGDSRTL